MFKNVNAQSIADREKDKRDKMKHENEQKKQQIKEAKEKQKQKAEERKEKEKKRTQKGERRTRWQLQHVIEQWEIKWLVYAKWVTLAYPAS